MNTLSLCRRRIGLVGLVWVLALGQLLAQVPAQVSGRVTDVKLVPGDKTLNEVVVMGYGTQEKKDLKGKVQEADQQRLIGK